MENIQKIQEIQNQLGVSSKEEIYEFIYKNIPKTLKMLYDAIILKYISTYDGSKRFDDFLDMFDEIKPY